MFVTEDVPPELSPDFEAIRSWLSNNHDPGTTITGIIDAQGAVEKRQRVDDRTVDISIILCSGETCSREDLRVTRTAGAYSVSQARSTGAPSEIPAHLDPPAGTRKHWLDEQLRKHEFLVLLFYRGFW